MSVNVVRDFIAKSQSRRLKVKIREVDKSLKQCLLDLVAYVENYAGELLGETQYTEMEIATCIYGEEFESTDPGYDDYAKINIYVGKQTLFDIFEEIKANGGLTNSNIKRFSQIIHELLADIGIFIDHFKKRENPNFRFCTGFKLYGISSFETFMLAKGFFYSSVSEKKEFLYYKESQGMVAMTIRQSIELKTKRVFGIDKIKRLVGNGEYSFKNLFRFLEENRHDIQFDDVEFNILRKIYTWSCGFIHNGDISYIWQNYFALKYLQRYFRPGRNTHQGRTTVSAFGSFVIRNYEAVQNRLVIYVGAKYEIVFKPVREVEAIIESI